ncbi:hypothetical protein B0H13DRAFT_1852178 [Mycena leptocephala]|nr:hypothetical protein B0H13DRAFT_1852178 [Mycena leptocephala]
MRTPSRSSVNWGQENKHAEESQGTPAGLKPPKSKSVPKVPSSQFKTSNDRLPRGEFMAYQNRLARNRLTLIDDIPGPSDEALTEGLIKYATRSYSREEKIQCLRDELAYTIRCNRANHGTEGANENFLFWTVFEFGDRFPHIVLSFARIIARSSGIIPEQLVIEKKLRKYIFIPCVTPKALFLSETTQGIVDALCCCILKFGCKFEGLQLKFDCEFEKLCLQAEPRPVLPMSSQKLTIVVLGARSAGKFADSYFPTIDCSYLTNITVNNIDTAGQDESFILKEEYIYKFQVLNRQITDLCQFG